MEPTAIVKLVLVSGIVLIVLAIGLRVRLVDPLLLFRQPALGARAMLAMFVALPLFAVLVTRVLPLDQGVAAALLGFAVSPMLPPWARKATDAGGHSDYIIDLQILATCVSIVVVPAMLWLVALVFGVQATFDPWSIATVLLVTVGMPLAIGMALARFAPDAAPRLAALADRIGGVTLLLGAVALLFASGFKIIGVIGSGTLVATVAIIAFGLLVGHLLGGPDPGNRVALATATASRHPGVALLLATGALPDNEPTILGTVLLYLIVSVVLTIPYTRWQKKVASAI